MRLLLDYVAGGLVFLNCLLLMLELEVEGRAVGAKVGFEDPVDVSRWLPFFKFIDTTFIFIFLLELLIRVWVEWPLWHRDLANLFDLCLVIAGMVDLFVIVPMAGNQSDAMMRVVRTLKSLRSVRLLRTFRFVRGLRLLVQACQCFLPSLCWSMVLLAVFMSMGALVLGNLLLEFSQNESEELEDRQWIWLHYGTAYRALYTLYEITFAGNWPTNVRPVLDKVSHAYVIFFLLYITIVVFAVIRVITAIFLKDTLDAAQNDSENLVVERLRKKAEYVERLEAVFKAIDRTGDGMITEERLEEILSHPKAFCVLMAV
ncbi:Scn11a [Symbiodinium microadriaticum]|nr:Scn11a [Symbiodinium microadriaticum]